MRTPIPRNPRRPALALALASVLAAGAPAIAPAQDGGDKGFLVNFLEESLSDAGRKVEITGFAGALSSRATLQRLTIADDQGVWLEIDDAVLDWSRTALLSGEVIINELSAGRIVLARIPSAGEQATSPEAGSFTLPELPVSVDIGAIRADRIELGAPVLGEALAATLEASLHLAGGEGSAALHLARSDPGPAEVIALEASYANATGALAVALDAQEGPGGLLSRAIGLPGAPATALSLAGKGTIDDFAAELRLATDGEERLAGPITISLAGDGARLFSARVEGNPAPLFLPEYAGFLGTDLDLSLTGRLHPDGRTDIDALSLGARTLSLRGRLSLAADGLPEAFDLDATLAQPGGAPVLLPLAGEPTTVGRADIELHFDAARSNGWTGSATLSDLAGPGLALASARLAGAGTITRDGAANGARAADGRLDFALTGLAGLDPAILAAVGPEAEGSLAFRWQDGAGTLDLTRITLAGADYGLEGHLRLRGLDEALTADGAVTAELRDLGRLSALAGRPLAGAGTLSLGGEASPLTGAFDLSLTLAGQGLHLGIAQADHLLAGRSEISAALRRDEGGLTLRALSANAASLRIDAAGSLSSGAMRLKGAIDWRDLSDLGAGFGGALAAKAGFESLPGNGTLTLDGIGHGLRIGQAELDRLIGGETTLSAELALAQGVPALRHFALRAPALSLTAAQAGGSDRIEVAGRLADLALIVPGFPGPVTLAGDIRTDGDGTMPEVELRLTGPAALEARLTGRVGTWPDLALALHSDAAILNGVLDPVTLAGALTGDLTLRGGWGLPALSGRVALDGGRLAVPARAVALERIALTAAITNGRASLAASAGASDGGSIRLEGPVSLTAPFGADLAATLSAVHLRDPGLYDTTLDGALRLSGPLLGAARLSGSLDLGPTELRVPSTASGALADIERFRHRGDSAATRATRQRAGVGVGASADPGRGQPRAGGPDWALDLVIRAANRVFLRGRGLDAELGGAIRLGGGLRNPVPSGGMELIRGRLDILGKRLELARAGLTLEGDFVPRLDVAATNVSDGVTSTVTISGPADDPEVSFASEPELPQEEVLAHLLFGRGLGKMSAFQAAQLASAVATLAGRGGEGIVGRLRTGLGLDDLDITTAETGEAEVTAGKYLSENIYTELSTDQNGKSRIDLNLIVRPGVTLRGRADSAGDSGLGIYLEGDY